jgi:2-oxoglutarate dehydrogenase E1 component
MLPDESLVPEQALLPDTRHLPDESALHPGNAAYLEMLGALPAGTDTAERRAAHAVAGERGEGDGIAVDGARVGVLQLINAYRFLGVRHADLDPLRRHTAPTIPELDPAHYGLTPADLAREFDTGSFAAGPRLPLAEVLDLLRRAYCGTIGVEYMHITDVPKKRWIQARIEGCAAGLASCPAPDRDARRQLLLRLAQAEALEQYLHTRYVGQKRFSLEGGEALLPLLHDLIAHCAEFGAREVVIGMAHRGRLNVLANLMGKGPRDIFDEFEGLKNGEGHVTGDVKYHQGFSADLQTAHGLVHLALAFNPSHLEIVHPVVRGAVRARQQRRADRDGSQVVPLVLHGDASFSGQGVVMESLNLSQTRGFSTGGGIHVVLNNQIGFTTSDLRDARSSIYCTDVAKMVEAPVFHVNADDPEAVARVARIAVEYRYTFRKNVFIDLVCYRRQGHNEQDDPLVTQPLMYKRIAEHDSVRVLYARRLEAEGAVAPGEVEGWIAAYRAKLDAGRALLPEVTPWDKVHRVTDWSPYRAKPWREPAETSVPLIRLRALADRLTEVPQRYRLHPRVQKLLNERRRMVAGEIPVDWGMAENLAYASLLVDGYPVRLTGQDSARGTFSHRHAVLHDQNRERWDEGDWVPLQHLAENQANFLVVDSLLSEEAVLAFEYGYASAEPNALTIWEAQFGDFANGAQVVIDQFIASAEAKWNRLCGIVLLLPHGQEGQGPEHSSARLERYMQLCANENMQVVQPTSAAQMFHLLRRQMLRPYRKPLIVMTPKSLLRHAAAASPIEQLAHGAFQPVLGADHAVKAEEVTRVIACSGKVYFELAFERAERKRFNVALLRIEQLYPFPDREFAAALAAYPNAAELTWAQEEAQNQGAWYPIQHHLKNSMPRGWRLGYAGRPHMAAPAAGYPAVHQAQTEAMMDMAFGPSEPGDKHAH